MAQTNKVRHAFISAISHTSQPEESVLMPVQFDLIDLEVNQPYKR